MGDETLDAVLYHASGGMALRGLSLFDGDRAGKQILLNPPSGLRLMGCNQPSFNVAYCFSGLEESNSFCKDVMDKGWSLATKLHVNVWMAVCGGSFGNSQHQHKVSEETLNSMVSEACITQCAYIPMKCFQIPRTSMTLCEAALAKARSIRDDSDADQFLKAFNSHVSESMYYLGGIFFKEVTLQCMEHTTLSTLMSQAERELNGSAEANLLGLQLFAATAHGRRQQKNEFNSSESSRFKLKSSAHRVSILGPTSAADDKEFLDKLHDDCRCWSIIDKHIDGKESLVSVWQLLLDHANSLDASRLNESLQYKTAAKRICERWCEITRTSQQKLFSRGEEDPLYFELIIQSRDFLSSLSADPIFPRSKEPLSEVVNPLLPLRQASLGELVIKLENIAAGQDHEMDVAQKVALHVRHFVKHIKESSNHNHKGALKSFHDHGFDADGNFLQSQLRMDVLNSIIDDLNLIQNVVKGRKRELLPSASINKTFPFSADYTSELVSTHRYRYVGDVLVDRNFNEGLKSLQVDAASRNSPSLAQSFKHAAARHLIACLRHRVNPVEQLLQLQAPGQASGGPPDDDWDCEDEVIEEEAANPVVDDQGSHLQLQQGSPLEFLIDIFQDSDLPAQIALCNLLLSQRAATLLVLPSSLGPTAGICPHGHKVVPFGHYIEPLSFVGVSLEKEKKVSIASDTGLPRVVFLSNKRVHDSHAAIVASRVLSCEFISQHSRRHMGHLVELTPLIEVGVGFVKSQRQGNSEQLACLAFHVTGPYLQLMNFINAIADVVVLEVDQEESHPDLKALTSGARVLRWQETERTEGSDKRKGSLWGQETYLVGEIKKFLYSVCQKVMQKSRESLKTVCVRQFPISQLMSFEESQGLIDHCDFKYIRKSLTLQRSFVKEAEAHFEFLKLRGDAGERKLREKRCDEERENRRAWAKDVIESPIMQLFTRLLFEREATSRRVRMLWLEKALSEKMYPVLEDAAGKVHTTLEASNTDPKNVKAREEYIKAKQEYVDKSLGVDNLWRELCHIFEADSRDRRDLAKAAAQHLLDGFPLEILDGDAGMFCKAWVDSVMAELDLMTRRKGNKPSRIFVLSVMGLQSSGKSTILNLMFGARLQTSAGRCTRGVYIQIVPAERAEYDYVMLLDTEGIRSPEYFGLEASEVRDNRLATLGLLPADASIFMVSNEDDSGLKEVLPMVLLAFKGSAMAEKCGGRIKAKMVFVYRSVDTNDGKKLMANKQKLYDYLKEAADHVANMGTTPTSEEQDLAPGSEGELLQSVFTNFRVDENETKSDIKCLGNLKKGHVPPSDTPDWTYGEQVLQLREYIHKRVMDDGWESRGFQEWGTHLTMVWDCICSADFELSFRSEVEYSSFRELEVRLKPPRTELLQKYLSEFEALEMVVRTMKEEESYTTLFSVLESKVEDVVLKKTKEVGKILEMKRWEKWRVSEQEKWRNFCHNSKESYKRRLVDMVSGVVKFEKVVTDYEKRIKGTILHKIGSGEWRLDGSSAEIKKRRFDEIFNSILQEAEEKHPPIATEIPERVMERYREAGVTKQFDMDGQSLRQLYCNGGNQSWHNKWRIPIGDPSGKRLQELCSELETMIDRQLKNARQYSEVIVDSVISQTIGKLGEKKYRNLNKEEAQGAHILVRDILTLRMHHIQWLWDQDYNVGGKLFHKAQPRLYEFFEARAQGMEAAALLIRELQSSLEDELQEAHNLIVVKKVAAQLGTADWVMEWRVMRNFLDYHLLMLMASNYNVDKLLRYVSDGSLHFQEMTNALIRQAIGSDGFLKEWQIILSKVQNCLMEECSIGGDRLAEVFLTDLARRLECNVESKLASSILSSINLDYYREHVLDVDFFQNKVPGLCESIKRKQLEYSNLEDMRRALAERVRKRMEDVEDEICRPRCGQRCPFCGSTCFHPSGHAAAQKHDCIHRPGGLSGSRWTRTWELMQSTCLQMLQTGSSMVFDDGRKVPFVEFEKEYPSWTLPAKIESGALQVAECIFFNYQKELARFHSTAQWQLKPCSSMPENYNHKPEELHTALYNKLRSHFKTEDAWTQFVALLQTL